MPRGPRLISPERTQLRLGVIDLESQLALDHPARIVWAFVKSADLSAFYSRIKARDDQPGRPASDPAVLLAVWLYATVDDVGSARAIERLCRDHAAYRWLCGGVPVNHDMLSAFRRDGGAQLDELLTRSLAGLVSEGLVPLDEAAIDGTKIRSRAGHSSMAGRERLAKFEALVSERIARLRGEIEQDPAADNRRRRDRAVRAAELQTQRLERARKRLEELEREKAERSKTHRVEEAAKQAPKVSTSDPEVRRMRMADGATRPAWNVQVATSGGFVVGIEPTDRRNDSGLGQAIVAQIRRRCGRTPKRLLADATAMTIEEIDGFSRTDPDLVVYSPVAKPREKVTPGSERNRRSRLRHEPEAVKQWRARMETDDAKEIYRRRKLTEHVHAKMKNRGFGEILVHGLAKVRVVCLFHALANNIMNAHRCRAIVA
jgi:transposase